MSRLRSSRPQPSRPSNLAKRSAKVGNRSVRALDFPVNPLALNRYDAAASGARKRLVRPYPADLAGGFIAAMPAADCDFRVIQQLPGGGNQIAGHACSSHVATCTVIQPQEAVAGFFPRAAESAAA